jgi:hypothetical protein
MHETLIRIGGLYLPGGSITNCRGWITSYTVWNTSFGNVLSFVLTLTLRVESIEFGSASQATNGPGTYQHDQQTR